MNWLQTTIVLVAAFLSVYVQTTFSGIRHLLGAQFDLLPGLIVYTSLSGGPVALALVSVCGGLWLDSLSANVLGISVLPLFAVGFVLQYYRGLILREQLFAQWILGLGASAAVPLLTLLLLLNTEQQPLVGWFSLWQWIVMACVGGAMTPLWFSFFDWVLRSLSYRQVEESSFRQDREIKRGRGTI